MSVKYTVWVGGSEVNDQHLTKEQAYKLVDAWKDKGYDDVEVEEVV